MADVKISDMTALSGDPASGDLFVVVDVSGTTNCKLAYSALVTALGSSFQAASANLTEYAAVNPTAAGLALLDDADAAAQRATLGLVIGTNVQAYNANLSNVRTVLTANRTYYVRTDGSDSNDGLANTSGGAFLTIQKAITTTAALDRSTYNVTIQVGSGTYTGAVSVTGWGPGSGSVTLLGDASTPTNCVISTTSVNAISVTAPVALTVNGFKLQTTTGGSCVYADNCARVNLLNINFGAAAYAHVLSWWGAKVDIQSNYTISGGGARHWWALNGGINAAGYTVTISGTPAFSEYFAAATLNGAIYAVQTWSGSATGPRFLSDGNASIFTAGTTLPGNSAGTTQNGGVQW